MIAKIVINKNVAILYNQHDVVQETTDSLIGYLFTLIEIAEGTTFHDIWQFILKDEVLYNQLYREVLGKYPLKLWADEARKPSLPLPTMENPKNGIEYLEVKRLCETNDMADEPCLFLNLHFHGWGPQTNSSNEDDAVMGGWSLCFTPLSELLPYPIKINEDFQIAHYSSEKGYFRDQNTFSTPVTWGEFLECIFNEISFYGSPNQQAKTKEEVFARAQEAIEHPENLISLEEIIKDLENK